MVEIPNDIFIGTADPILLFDCTGKEIKGHFISIIETQFGIISRVSLFGRCQYIIHMTHNNFITIHSKFESAHIFDVRNKVVINSRIQPLTKCKWLHNKMFR